MSIARLLTLFAALALPAAAFGQATVTAMRTPDGGIQPRVTVGDDGTVHLLYFTGKPEAGDLFYAAMKPGETEFGKAMRVNADSGGGNVIAAGAVRGGRMVLGKAGRPHVVWNSPYGAGIQHARLKDDGSGFEPPKNLVQFSTTLDGGADLAADGAGNVFALWHANERRGDDDSQRKVFLARSFDGGGAFGRESAVTPQPIGASASCALSVLVMPPNRLLVLVRSATGNSERGMHLLVSDNGGITCKDVRLDAWNVAACPMSTAAMARAGETVLLAWERDGQIILRRFDPATAQLGPVVVPPGDGKARKHPTLAVAASGGVLLAWTEGATGHAGGVVAWQAYDAELQPISDAAGRAEGLPAWGAAAAFAKPDGSFVVIY